MSITDTQTQTTRLEALMERATRAAALLLNYHVCRFLVACRADLSFFHGQVLRSLSRCARAEGLRLYSGSLRWSIEIDERDLRRSAVGLARLRMLGQPVAARVLEQEVLSRAVSARGAT
jgi:hypothetical protein